jgi:hypothetical protein
MRFYLPLVLLACPFLPAQDSVTAHPQETLQNGNGHLVPFGVTNSGSFGEGHTMILVPKEELPTTACLLTGMEIHGQLAATLDYASLVIHAAPTTATSLQLTFANNYGAVTPTQVLNATSLQVSYQSNAFATIAFTVPYVHDGSSALLLEVQKVVQTAATYPFQTMSTTSSPVRTDRPSMIHAFGTPGSGASQATQAQFSASAIVVRLLWQATPTIRHRSDIGPGQFQYGIGGTVNITTNGVANGLYVLVASDGYLPFQIPVPGFGGAVLVGNPIIFAGGLLDGSGVANDVLTLPNDPAIVGFHLFYQGATVDLTGFITLTNGMDHFVNA